MLSRTKGGGFTRRQFVAVSAVGGVAAAIGCKTGRQGNWEFLSDEQAWRPDYFRGRLSQRHAGGGSELHRPATGASLPAAPGRLPGRPAAGQQGQRNAFWQDPGGF